MVFPFKDKGFTSKSLCYCVVVLPLCLLKFIHSYIEFFPTSDIRDRFDWEQWPEKKQRRQESRSLTPQTLAIGRCRSKIICMGRNYIFLFWEGNQIIWKKKNRVFLIDRC